jgi:hypothetical protein
MPAVKDPPRQGVPAGRLFELGGKRTLDDLLASLEVEAADGTATCPVCHAAVLDPAGGGALACSGCGSRLEAD